MMSPIYEIEAKLKTEVEIEIENKVLTSEGLLN